jgi:hypothetical protein
MVIRHDKLRGLKNIDLIFIKNDERFFTSKRFRVTNDSAINITVTPMGIVFNNSVSSNPTLATTHSARAPKLSLIFP